MSSNNRLKHSIQNEEEEEQEKKNHNTLHSHASTKRGRWMSFSKNDLYPEQPNLISDSYIADNIRAEEIKQTAHQYINNFESSCEGSSSEKKYKTRLPGNQAKYIRIIILKVLSKLCDIISRIKNRIISMKSSQGLFGSPTYLYKFVYFRQWMTPKEADSYVKVIRIVYEDNSPPVYPSEMLALYAMIKAKTTRKEGPFQEPEKRSPAPRKNKTEAERIDVPGRNRNVLICFLMCRSAAGAADLLNEKYLVKRFTEKDVELIVQHCMKKALEKMVNANNYYARRYSGEILCMTQDDMKIVLKQPMDPDLKLLLIKSTITGGYPTEEKIDYIMNMLEFYKKQKKEKTISIAGFKMD